MLFCVILPNSEHLGASQVTAVEVRLVVCAVECGPKNLVFDNIWLTWRHSPRLGLLRKSALKGGISHSKAKIRLVQHFTAISATAELLFDITILWRCCNVFVSYVLGVAKKVLKSTTRRIIQLLREYFLLLIAKVVLHCVSENGRRLETFNAVYRMLSIRDATFLWGKSDPQSQNCSPPGKHNAPFLW